LLQSCSNLSIGSRGGNKTFIWYRLAR
jgi:hypothetical protein